MFSIFATSHVEVFTVRASLSHSSGAIRRAVPRRRSLRTRFVVATTFTVVSVFALYAVSAVRVQRDALAEAERARQVLAVRRGVEHLSTLVSGVSSTTDRVGAALTDPRIESDAVRLALAREAVGASTGLHDVAVYLPDGSLIDALLGAGASALPAPLPTMPPAGLGGRYDTERYAEGVWLSAGATENGPLVRYVKRVEREGQLRAWVVGTLSPQRFCEVVATVSAEHLGAADRLSALEEGARSLTQACGRPDHALEYLGQIGQFEPREAIRNDFGLSREVRGRDGVGRVVTVQSLPALGWLLVAERPTREAYAALEDARRALIVRAVASVLAAALMGAWLAARVTRPIMALTRLALAYGRREFTRRAELTTRDELATLGGAMEEMADEIRRGEAEMVRRDRVERDLARYLPASVAGEIARGEREVALGGQRAMVTVLFADVVGFTPFAEANEPERVLGFLNDLFTVLSEVVFRHGGTLDKYLGDCVMAVFGAPTPQADHVARALAVAEDMHRFVSSGAALWRSKYNFEVRLAIGIHTGEALVGNLGSEARLDYTVIGDTVNVAARLETLASPGRTLVSEAVMLAAGDVAGFVSLGAQPLRGKREAVSVYEVET